MKWALLFVLFAGLAPGEELPEVFQDPALQHFYNLEFDQALALFQARVAKNPMSAEAYNLVAQTVIFRTMYQAGALESSLVSDTNPFFDRPKAQMKPEDEKLFLDSIQQAMDLSEMGANRYPPDPKALYTLGVAYGLRADYNFIIRKAWFSTLRDATQARKQHQRLSELQPDNYDARLTQGLHTYVAGNLVFPWKQLGFLAGFRGTKEGGIKILQEVAEKGVYTKVDANVFLEAIYRRDHMSAKAIPIALQLIQWFPRNYMFKVELAYLYHDIQDKAAATATVAEIEQAKKDGTPNYNLLSQAKLDALKKMVE